MQENGNSDVSLINKELKRTFWTKNKWMFFISVLCLSVLSALNVYISVLMQQIIDIIAEPVSYTHLTLPTTSRV